METTTKYCKYCNQTKDISKFKKRKDSIDGYKHMCYDCININYKNTQVKWRESNKDKIKSYELKRIKKLIPLKESNCIECNLLILGRVKIKRCNECKSKLYSILNDKRICKHCYATFSKSESGISINKLLKRDGTKCLICGKEVLKKNISGYHKDNATIGHIISLSNGGNHSMDNIQLECMECNVKKGNRDTI